MDLARGPFASANLQMSFGGPPPSVPLRALNWLNDHVQLVDWSIEAFQSPPQNALHMTLAKAEPIKQASQLQIAFFNLSRY